MDFTSTVNLLIAPLGCIIIIIIDYMRNRISDTTQYRTMMAILFTTLLSIVSESLYDLFAGNAEMAVLIHVSNFAFFVFQTAAMSLTCLFLDYNIHKNVERYKRLKYIFILQNVINILILIININTGFIYYIGEDYLYYRNDYFFIRSIIGFMAPIVALFDIVLSRKVLSKKVLVLCIFFAAPMTVGTTIDVFFPGMRLVWPSFLLSILFAYLFIVRSDYSIDSLTGIYNRRYCDEYLMELAKLQRRKPYSIFMIDANSFKEINDVFGHIQGDQALRDIAGILKSSVRNHDFVARYGGDEFIIVARSDAPEIVENRIQANVDNFNATSSRMYKLSLSIGYDNYLPDDKRSISELITHIDALMYQKKQQHIEKRHKR